MKAPLDWHSSASELRLNPRLPPETRRNYEEAWGQAPQLSGHLWLTTSGTTAREGRGKLVALSKAAFLASAKAVNRHLAAQASDVWLQTLPDFHVGGLGIYARAYLNGSKVIENPSPKWEPLEFYRILEASRATLTSLVPSQVFDLVRAGLRAPPALRAVVVGGGALPPALNQEARARGWPLLPSFGLTECCSQVATAPLESLESTESEEVQPSLHLLSHIEARTGSDGFLELKSPALLTGTLLFGGGEPTRFVDPKVDGWLKLEDRAELSGRVLRPLGREQDFVKIGGESVNLQPLQDRLQAAALETDFTRDSALLAVPDPRLGSVLCLLTDSGSGQDIERLRAVYDDQVLPYERIRRVHQVAALPRSPLGKLILSEALALIGLES